MNDELPSEIDPTEVHGLIDDDDNIIAVGFPTAEDEAKRLIDPVAVETIFVDCLYADSEVIGGVPPSDAIVVEGVVNNFGFHPGRLASHRDEVRAILAMLPVEFHSRATGGEGGWSFLQACTDKNGTLWTGLHRRVEQLLALGIALGFVQWQIPREYWAALPGGVPYLEIDV